MKWCRSLTVPSMGKIYDDQILSGFIMSESSVNVEPIICWTFNEDWWYVNNQIKGFQGFNDLTLTGDVCNSYQVIGSTAMSLSKEQSVCHDTGRSLQVITATTVWADGSSPDRLTNKVLPQLDYSRRQHCQCVLRANMNASGTMTAKSLECRRFFPMSASKAVYCP